jgi:hypothetical protein
MSTSSGRTRIELKVDTTSRPEWKTGVEVPVAVGTEVFCTEGRAEVTRMLGKTSDGSRLLELKLIGVEARPFFAAASNVLVAPPTL